MTDYLSGVCRALAHPVRRALLRSLSTGECDVGNLCAGSALDQPTVSKHLAALRHAGLVQVRVEGPRRCYSLAHEESVRSLLALLDQLERDAQPSSERHPDVVGEDGRVRHDEVSPRRRPSGD